MIASASSHRFGVALAFNLDCAVMVNFAFDFAASVHELFPSLSAERLHSLLISGVKSIWNRPR
ncbi:MAG TPA: hypothetical protein VNU97_06345 [Rhizomicrobium sp.]|jgi:hypothetical protein|nr:hypothetical protein [Rhizomicrobium sp.]